MSIATPRSLLQATLVVAALFLCTGCATVITRAGSAVDQGTNPGAKYELYPATRFDLMMLGMELKPDGKTVKQRSCLVASGTVLDLPFSLITDTILFPYDFVRWHRQP